MGKAVVSKIEISGFRQVRVKERKMPLFLTKKTKELMAERDRSAFRRDWPLYNVSLKSSKSLF